MTKTLLVNDIRITFWTVDVESRSVSVSYDEVLDDGTFFKHGSAIFWETIPDPVPGAEDYIPDNWYQLPAQYVNFLTDLTADARTALLHLIN